MDGRTAETIAPAPTAPQTPSAGPELGPAAPDEQAPSALTPTPSGDPRALEALSTVFGYDSFRGEQAQIIDQVIGGGCTSDLLGNRATITPRRATRPRTMAPRPRASRTCP